MFDLQITWWELPLRATIIYVALLAMVRISGRRTVGQFTPFDLLVVMLLSEAVSNGLSGGEDSVAGSLISAMTLVGLNLLVGVITAHSQRVQTLVEGRPILVGRNGKIFDDVLKARRVPVSEVDQALRAADCDRQDMRYAFLEADGEISILKDSGGGGQAA